MSDHNPDRLTEYREKCGCGRIVLIPAQATGHTQHCDQMPADSQLLGEGVER